MLPRRLLAALGVAALVALACNGASGASGVPGGSAAAACPATTEPAPETVTSWSGSQTPSVIPQIIDPGGTIACGENRLLFSFIDPKTNAPVAKPDRTVSLALYDLGKDTTKPVTTAEAEFIWAIPDQVGVYKAEVDIPTSGLYGAEFTTSVAGGASEVIKLPFDVRPTRSVVSVGDPAPATDNPTLASVGGDISKISTDPHPVPAFYGTTVKEALAKHEPFVLVFATPKFCVSSQCGPTLDRVKPIAAAHPDVPVINVEPYQLKDVDGQLQPVLTADNPPNLTPVDATTQWRIPSEPWIFVVDKDGIVRSSLMLIFSDDELTEAIKAVE